MELKISKFNIDNKLYLSILTTNTNIVDYQIEVINNNNELPILNIKVQTINNTSKFNFDITGYLTLQEYTKAITTNKNDLIYIMQNITSTIINSENYLLKKSNLVLKQEDIFVNPITKEVKMIYIPTKEKVYENDYESIRDFLIQMIDNAIKKDNNNVLLRDISKYLKQEYYNLQEVKRKLDAIIHQEIVPQINIENNTQNEVKVEKRVEKKKKDDKQGVFSKLFGSNKKVVVETKQESKSIENNISDVQEEVIIRTNKLVSFLYFESSNTQEKIYIDKDIFLLGRLPEVVDYAISNGAIGRVHARIEKDNNKYYLTDLSSRNGTFINGNRLEANNRYELYDGCQVRLANTIMYFKK